MGKGVYDTNSPHFKGTFLTIYAVNQKYPAGGVDGDWCLINGWAHYWDADRGTWCVNSQRDTYWDELFSGVKFNTENIMKKYEYLLFDLSKKANTSDVQASLEKLKKEIGDRTVVEGNVTNLPDEEDITSGINESGTDVLSFKDRDYNPLSFSGKGYKILRKNIKPVSLAVTKIIVGSIPSVDGAIVFTINGVEVSVDMVTTTMTSTDLVAQKIAEKLTETMIEYEVSKDASTITLTRKFGGKVSTPSSFSAVGTGASCIITDSNKIELRNILKPIMMNQPNTIYEIRYDFDLNGETIEMQEGCTLKFEGGCLVNGKIKMNNSLIKGNPYFNHLSVSGTIKNNEAYLSWFGSDYKHLVCGLQFCKNLKIPSFILDVGEKIELEDTIIIQDIEIKGGLCNRNFNVLANFEDKPLFVALRAAVFKNLYIQSLNSKNNLIEIGGEDDLNPDVIIEHCKFSGGYDAIHTYVECDNLDVNHCVSWWSHGHAFLNIETGDAYLSCGVNIHDNHLNMYGSLDDDKEHFGIILKRCEQSCIKNVICNNADTCIKLERCQQVVIENVHLEKRNSIIIFKEGINVKTNDLIAQKYNEGSGYLYRVLEDGVLKNPDSWKENIGDVFTAGVKVKCIKRDVGLHVNTSSVKVSHVRIQGLVPIMCYYANLRLAFCNIEEESNVSLYISSLSNVICSQTQGHRILIPDDNCTVRVDKSTFDFDRLNEYTTYELLRFTKTIKQEITSSQSFDGSQQEGIYYINATNGNIDIDVNKWNFDQFLVGREYTFVRSDNSNNRVTIISYNDEYQYLINKGDYCKVCLGTIGSAVYSNCRVKSFPSESRPNYIPEGYTCYDSTLKKYILWNGSAWVNLDGTELTAPTSNEQGAENP